MDGSIRNGGDGMERIIENIAGAQGNQALEYGRQDINNSQFNRAKALEEYCTN